MRTTCPILLLLLAPGIVLADAPWLPTAPGVAHCQVNAGGAELSNAALRFAIAIKGSSLKPAALDNHFAGQARALDGELFDLQLRDSKTPVPASAFRLDGKPTCAAIVATADASRAADRHPGMQLQARL